MKNKQPVFIVAFARGGSNILLNLLRSHPDVCSPRGETHEVFRGAEGLSFNDNLIRRLKYLFIILAERRDVFAVSDWQPRDRFTQFSARLIDHLLYADRFKRKEIFKAPGINKERYELKSNRLLCKNTNGLIFLTRQFYEIYSDATFIALVRDPRAVCEGHIRRNAYPLQDIAINCSKALTQIIKDETKINNYHVFRYEDLVKNPDTVLKRIFLKCDLDLEKLKFIRLETKSVVGYDNIPKGKQLVWYKPYEFSQHILPDANKNQINRLTIAQRKNIESICFQVMKHFQYL